MSVSLFKKQKNVPLPEPQTEKQSTSMEEVHASSPAPDTAAVIGGLEWYRAQFRRAMKLALGLTVALCASAGVAAILFLNQPKPQYFAATPDLRLAPMIPLDQPLLTQEGLLTWVSDTITGAMSLNFLEWREKLESIRPHFDDAAYKSFLASLQSSGVLDMIRDKRLSASAVATRAPVIIASGLVGGKATWKVEFPLIVSYESSQGVENTQKLLATVLVCRASTAKTPRGVVIQQVVLKRDA